ncbi:BamA/TamA family outer membrane protein [Daejeonella lutea]|uniref:Surface antigen n=1 Tax=Daejeonella lutea TaxID=572036 RepID=A0A1T5BIH0_9SPHI|nr:BamA/TamA family outer membrane protein [Daejeonella lutea]SKB47048.1 Surface antigen [Daejeonella lutea]
MSRILILFLITFHFAVSSSAQGIGQPETLKGIKDTTEEPGLGNRLLGARLSPTADLRAIDGISLGLSYKIQRDKSSSGQAGSFQNIKALHSLTTSSFVIEYEADIKEVFGRTDLTIKALADMNGNIINFFGLGNDTEFDQSGDFRKYYRVNFSFYELKPALRFKLNKEVSITAGPSLQHFVDGSNDGRYFNTPAVSTQFTDLYTDKLHGGLLIDFNWDRRDDKVLPTRGINFNILAQGFEGLNKSSQSFAQLFSQLSFYKSLDANGNFVLANRIGGGLTIGSPAFYQSAFLGSQDNLLGFRKHRFAGDHVLYNNLEARITIPNFLRKLMPGKIGFIGSYDAGRIWVKNESSNTIHHGFGAGVFATPFNKLFIRGIAGFSNERLQPTVALRQRF